VGHLYSILIPLSASVRFEDKASFESAEDDTTPTTIASQSILASEADLLFKAIEGAFITTRIKNSPSRMLIFAKRLLTCALQWPTETAIRTIDVVRKMLVKEPALESMLSVEDSMLTGVYNGMTDEMHLVGAEATVWWELVVLQQSHFDERVRDAAERLAHFARNH
jgi:nucleolar complex protein 3